MKESRLYVIPTTRNCCPTLESVAAELVNYSANDRLQFLLLDQSEANVAAENYSQMFTMACDIRNVDFYYITTAQIDGYIDEFVSQNKLFGSFAAAKYFRNAYSYGMTANRISLLAASMNAKYVHRRDSDVMLQKINGRSLSPFEIECKCLGKKIKRDEKLINGAEVEILHNDLEKIYVVGSGYIGDWPVDYDDLSKSHMESLYDITHQGRKTESRENVVKMVNRKLIHGCSETYRDDEFNFYEFDLIELGNYSIFDIFNYLPIAPSVQTSGIDYYYQSILKELGLPMMYHNRRLVHGYTTERKSSTWKNKYYLGLVMFRCVKPFYAQLFERIKNNPCNYFDGERFNGELISNDLKEISTDSMIELQYEIAREISQIYGKIDLEKYQMISRAILENEHEIVGKTVGDVEAHAELTKFWPLLINEFRKNDVLSRHQINVNATSII